MKRKLEESPIGVLKLEPTDADGARATVESVWKNAKIEFSP